MAKLTFNSAGVGTQEIDLTGPVTQPPVGIPAGVIGTAKKGPAFVPVTVGSIDDFFARFGTSDGKKFGPLAVSEWLRNAGAVTYLRVLGAGTGEKRTTTGNTAGSVASAGFVVGEQQPTVDGGLGANPYANANGVLGRTYFLGCYMSESAGSTVFSDAGLRLGLGSAATGSVPIVRGVLLAPSGVVLRLSSSLVASAAPTATAIAVADTGQGALTGTVKLLEGGVAKQEFVMLLNGHKGTDANYPNVITASFDMTAQNYFGNLFNTDPLKQQQAGHYLYARYDVHPAMAAVTGTGIINATATGSLETFPSGFSPIAFLTTGALDRNVGSATVPNYENFEDRFDAPKSPWVVSQKFGGTAQNLFRIESLDDGDYAQRMVKVSIENLAASTDDADKYGTFDVIVRKIDDDDQDFSPLEEFRGLSLNPSSDRYIAKAIGDLRVFYDFDKVTASQKLAIEGSFANRSNWIRVVLNSKVDDGEVDPTAMPFGFRGPAHLVTSGSAPLHAVVDTTEGATQTASGSHDILKRAVQPPVPLRRDITLGAGAKKQVSTALYWGVKFQQTTDPLELNKGKLFDNSIYSYTKYFPDFMTVTQNVVAKDNEGAADTETLGVIDADRFLFNAFSLENVKVTTGSDAKADVKTAVNWTYVRQGSIAADESAKTRGMNIEDLKKPAVRPYAKFSFYLQGGFDGVNVFDNDEATLSNIAVNEEMDNANRGTNNGPTVKAYNKALDIMKETSDVDVKLLAIPGIRHSVVTDAAVLAVEDRFDAMYIMDIESYDELNSLVTSSATQNDHVGNTVTSFTNRNVDTNFAAAYYPDMVMVDPTLNVNVRVPSSVAVLGAFALNDSIGFPWFAPAGFARGSLAGKEATVKLSRENMDTLYAADINPIVAFPNSNGPVVWGQKTLQKAQTALDRVNVRRLLIELRRQVREVAQTILFEPNRESTLSRFSAAVRPRMEAIQARQGVEQFRVQIDASTTSQADVENNTIRGIITVRPTRVAEFVSLTFVVTNSGQFI